MKESLIEKLNRLELEVEKLKAGSQGSNKSQCVDIKAEVEKIVDEPFVTNLYRNK